MKDDNPAPSKEVAAAMFQQLQTAIENTPISQLTNNVEKEHDLDPYPDTVTLREAVHELRLSASLGNQRALQELVYVGSTIAKWLPELTITASEGGNSTEDISNNTEETEHHDDGIVGAAIGEIQQLPEPHQKGILEGIAQKMRPPEFTYVDNHGQLVDQICNRLIQKKIDKVVGENVRSLASKSIMWPVAYPAIKSWKGAWVDKYVTSIGLGNQLDHNLTHKTGFNKDQDPTTFTWYGLVIHLFNELNTARTKQMSAPHIEEWRKAEANNEGVEIEPGTKVPKYHPRPTSEIRTEWHVDNIWRRKAKFLPELSIGTIDSWLDALMARIAVDCDGKFLDCPWPSNVVTRANKNGEWIGTAVREYLAIQLKKIAKAPPKRTPENRQL